MRGLGIVGLCEDVGLLDGVRTRDCWIVRGRGIVGRCEDEGLLDCARTRDCWTVRGRGIVGLCEDEGLLDCEEYCWTGRGSVGFYEELLDCTRD